MSIQNNVADGDILKSRKNLLNQLENIGYETNNYKNEKLSEITEKKNNNQLNMLLVNENKNTKIYVYYYLGDTQLKANAINSKVEVLFDLVENGKEQPLLNRETDTLYIITKDNCRNVHKNLIEIFNKTKTFIIVQPIKNLLFNILEHSIVPKHIVLTKEESESMLHEQNIVKSDMPTISRFDPAAKAIGLKPNEICKILRSSPTAVVSIYYRLCINEDMDYKSS